MPIGTAVEVKAWARCWGAVKAFELQERRDTTVEERVHLTDLLFASGGLFSRDPERARNSSRTRARWRRLRVAYRARL